MKKSNLKTPVVFIIFNRPDVTEKVFSRIAEVKPESLYVISDGPRFNNVEDKIKVNLCREIIKRVNWKCKVYKNYSKKNLGCKMRISSGLDWVFNKCNEAIILEDDCYPNLSFFQFCEELLLKYKDDTRVGMISGDNFLFGNGIINSDYYFSRYPAIWGWATWKRTWNLYDVEIKEWHSLVLTKTADSLFPNIKLMPKWTKIFNETYEGKINTWDYQLVFTCWKNNMASIRPKFNLVTNIGFRDDATHTTKETFYSNMQAKELQFPLAHPGTVYVDNAADRLEEKILESRNIFFRFLNKLHKNFTRLI